MITVVALCRCGHPEEMHEHYRPGRDCGACGPTVCPRYSPDHGIRVVDDTVSVVRAAGWLARLLPRRLRPGSRGTRTGDGR